MAKDYLEARLEGTIEAFVQKAREAEKIKSLGDFVRGYITALLAAGILDPRKDLPDGPRHKEAAGKAKRAFQRWYENNKH